MNQNKKCCKTCGAEYGCVLKSCSCHQPQPVEGWEKEFEKEFNPSNLTFPEVDRDKIKSFISQVIAKEMAKAIDKVCPCHQPPATGGDWENTYRLEMAKIIGREGKFAMNSMVELARRLIASHQAKYEKKVDDAIYKYWLEKYGCVNMAYRDIEAVLKNIKKLNLQEDEAYYSCN